jgi:hypothetical protein
MKSLLFCYSFFFLLLNQTIQLTAQTDLDEGLDKIFHTADIEGETATQWARRKTQNTQALPEGSSRIGCVCMTGEVRSTTSTGSCAGHGGVRYWLVINAQGDTLQYPTARQALNSDNEPAPYIGPSPQMRYTTQPPTIIFMPSQANGFVDMPMQQTPQYRMGQDSQIVLFQALPTPYDSTRRVGMDKTALFGLPLIFDSLIQLCTVLVICGTLLIIVRMFLQQGEQQPLNSQKIFKRIRLTLFKILFKNNKFKE